MEDNYLIKFTNFDKGELTLQLNSNTTFKEMARKYSIKADIPLEKFGKTFFFYYQGYILDLNSDENISTKLKQNDVITVEEKEENKNSTIYNNNKSRRADIFLRNNSINNRYKMFSQSQSQSQSIGYSQSSLGGAIEEAILYFRCSSKIFTKNRDRGCHRK